MEYPLMLFKGGDITAEYLIVDDAEEEAVASEDGFVRAGALAAENSDSDSDSDSEEEEEEEPTDERSALIASLQEAGIEFDKRWGVVRLRSALEGKQE